MQQFGSAGTQVGLASSNNFLQQWRPARRLVCIATNRSPSHSAKSLSDERWGDNTERFEQIGQSWLKHAFIALEEDACGFGCNTRLRHGQLIFAPGCSDPYSASLNGDQTRSVRAPGSIRSLVTFHRMRTITAAIRTTACRTGFWLKSMI